MPYTRISSTRNGADAIKYALGNGKGHNNNDFRNAYVSGVNMLPPDVESYESQMDKYWRLASSRNKYQIRRVIQSFSRNELDPDNPDDVMRSHELGKEFAKTAYPGRQCIICTQIDGKSGLIHNHILVNNVSMTAEVVTVPKSDGTAEKIPVPERRGCIDEQTYFSYVKDHTNAIAKKYFELDFGKNRKERHSQAERTRRDQGKYVWKDDLRERIDQAAADATSFSDFVSRLEAQQVRTEERNSKKRGKYYLYELLDNSNFGPDDKKPVSGLKVKSFKLGNAYEPKDIEAGFTKNAAKAAEQEADAEHDTDAVQAAETLPVTESETTMPQWTPPEENDDLNFADWAESQGLTYADMDEMTALLIEHSAEFLAAQKADREARAAAKAAAEQIEQEKQAVQRQSDETAAEAATMAALEEQREDRRRHLAQHPAVTNALEQYAAEQERKRREQERQRDSQGDFGD